jgi:hypothetical protein
MSALSYDEIVRLAEQLPPGERFALALHLLATAQSAGQVTLETIQAEHARRRAAGAFEQAESLRNKYAEPGLDLSEDDLRAGLSEFATDWETELDDLAGSDV